MPRNDDNEEDGILKPFIHFQATKQNSWLSSQYSFSTCFLGTYAKLCLNKTLPGRFPFTKRKTIQGPGKEWRQASTWL